MGYAPSNRRKSKPIPRETAESRMVTVPNDGWRCTSCGKPIEANKPAIKQGSSRFCNNCRPVPQKQEEAA